MYHRIQTITFDPRFIDRDDRIDVSKINGLLRIWSGTPAVCHSFDIVAHENITFRRINLGLSCVSAMISIYFNYVIVSLHKENG
jgi:hypothetical protein